MPIDIVPSGTPIQISAIVTLILGNPGVGKTTLANTADAPLLLDFDRGSHRSLKRPDTVLIDRWKKIENLSREDLKPYRTLIVDTVGRCLDVLAEDIMTREPKMSNGGQLSLQGFGRLKARFRQWLNQITGYGINVVLVAHATEERHGDDVRLRVDGQGASKEEVYKMADLMGRITIRDGKRHLDWNPSDTGFGKNPGNLDAGAIPNVIQQPDFLNRCIRSTLDFLSQKSEEAVQEEKRLGELRGVFEAIETPEEFTKIARNMRDTGAPNSDRSILVSVATERKWVLDKSTLVFSDPNAPPPPPEEEQVEEEEQEAGTQATGEAGTDAKGNQETADEAGPTESQQRGQVDPFAV